MKKESSQLQLIIYCLYKLGECKLQDIYELAIDSGIYKWTIPTPKQSIRSILSTNNQKGLYFDKQIIGKKPLWKLKDGVVPETEFKKIEEITPDTPSPDNTIQEVSEILISVIEPSGIGESFKETTPDTPSPDNTIQEVSEILISVIEPSGIGESFKETTPDTPSPDNTIQEVSEILISVIEPSGIGESFKETQNSLDPSTVEFIKNNSKIYRENYHRPEIAEEIFTKIVQKYPAYKQIFLDEIKDILPDGVDQLLTDNKKSKKIKKDLVYDIPEISEIDEIEEVNIEEEFGINIQGIKDVFIDAFNQNNFTVVDSLICELFVNEKYNESDYIIGLKKQVRDCVNYYYKTKNI